jgi:septal ring factor EnvC (AmiA/AmiB activator)
LEAKKCETLRHELDDVKKKLNAMSADNNRLKSNLNSSDGKEKQQRKRLDEMNQQMVECEEKLRLANKEKVIILNWFINSLNTISSSSSPPLLLLHHHRFVRDFLRRVMGGYLWSLMGNS